VAFLPTVNDTVWNDGNRNVTEGVPYE